MCACVCVCVCVFVSIQSICGLRAIPFQSQPGITLFRVIFGAFGVIFVCFLGVFVPAVEGGMMEARAYVFVSGTSLMKSYVSQWCYSGVAVVLQWRYRGVTVALPWCYSSVTVVLQWRSRDIHMTLAFKS
jgi:hypothetical protein